jgi:putative sigma-54 modulation protein
MQLNLTGNHVEITPALRDYVQSKLTRVERHFDHMTTVHVILSIEKQRHRAEATLHVTGADLFANAEDEDMYAAVDAMMDRIDRQVRRHKEKLTDHHRGDNHKGR